MKLDLYELRYRRENSTFELSSYLICDYNTSKERALTIQEHILAENCDSVDKDYPFTAKRIGDIRVDVRRIKPSYFFTGERRKTYYLLDNLFYKHGVSVFLGRLKTKRR